MTVSVGVLSAWKAQGPAHRAPRPSSANGRDHGLVGEVVLVHRHAAHQRSALVQAVGDRLLQLRDALPKDDHVLFLVLRMKRSLGLDLRKGGDVPS